MTKCTESGCRSLEWKCADCGRVASSATFPPAEEWVSVKDRFPKDGERVLIYCGYTDIKYYENIAECSPMFYDGETHCYCPLGMVNGVTHWMPLPESPA